MVAAHDRRRQKNEKDGGTDAKPGKKRLGKPAGKNRERGSGFRKNYQVQLQPALDQKNVQDVQGKQKKNRQNAKPEIQSRSRKNEAIQPIKAQERSRHRQNGEEQDLDQVLIGFRFGRLANYFRVGDHLSYYRGIRRSFGVRPKVRRSRLRSPQHPPCRSLP